MPKYSGKYLCGETGKLHSFNGIEAPSKTELAVVLGDLSQSVVHIETAYTEAEITALKGDKAAAGRYVEKFSSSTSKKDDDYGK
jgi:hypothetical protein